jgi:hypothetical protein
MVRIFDDGLTLARFGSDVDMWSAIADVCYVPIADKPSLAANWRGGAVTR